MDIDSRTPNKTICFERLQRALRVMQGLSEIDRTNFSLWVWAVQRDSGISGCIAGLCGLDPWFQSQGLVTTVGTEGHSIGSVSIEPLQFFGTNDAFLLSRYKESDCTYDVARQKFDVTADTSTIALKRALRSFATTTVQIFHVAFEDSARHVATVASVRACTSALELAFAATQNAESCWVKAWSNAELEIEPTEEVQKQLWCRSTNVGDYARVVEDGHEYSFWRRCSLGWNRIEDERDLDLVGGAAIESAYPRLGGDGA